MTTTAFAVGSLVSARGREWIVLPESEPDLLVLRPLGATDAEIAGILPALEPVRPAMFDPPNADKPGDARSAALLRDALRLGFRSSAGPFRSFGQINVDPRPYQLVPLMMALRLDPVRLLIADDVGVGKTIEAALIARELLDQGSAERLAVLCPPHLAEQWQSELRTKFNIDAELVLASTARRLERGLGVGESLFEVYDNVIVSTDFIKAERHRDDFVRTCPELVIVDEAHGFAFGGDRGRQLRHELLVKLAADQDRHLILVTATPHSGKDDAFRSLLELLDPSFANLPDDLSGAQNERERRRLARHLVQRRRGDIDRFLDETPFPEREQADSTYKLTPEYRRLFDRAVTYARETWREAEGDRRRQRVHWWSALGLLRSLGSSPDAAVATLRNRAQNAAARTAEEADELGRRAVFDMPGDDEAESTDLAPGARYDADDDPGRSDSWFNELARDAAALAGDKDPKLQAAIKLVKELVGQGHNPIVFCRFIPTADYVAGHLQKALGKKAQVMAVTGTIPPADREDRIAQLATHEHRVLVATDCLSEGINLQESFDAVVHYDLSWNPTRHEQREGRVDRYGQPKPIVRVVTFYGANSPIDGLVLDVLLRKHQRIRKALGVAVPVPTDSAAVIDAILEGLITRGRQGEAAFEQLSLELGDASKPSSDQLELEWQNAAEREKRTQTMFAQYAIKPEEVFRELVATREATGAGVDVRSFITEALRGYGATVREGSRGGLIANLEEVPAGLREAVGLAASDFSLEVARDGSLTLERTHPVVQAVAAHVLDSALDPYVTDPVAARCGAIRTRAVDRRTSLLLVRMRFHLQIRHGDAEPRQLLAEDARLLAFTGTPADLTWLTDEQAQQLLTAKPDANVPFDQAVRVVRRLIDGLPELGHELERIAGAHAEELLATHRRVREGARTGGSVAVEAQLPLDVLGVYVLLPVGEE